MRQDYLRALRREPSPDLVWAPNIDYWYSVSLAENTMPRPYVGMSCDDIIRSIGGALWRRAGGLRTCVDASVRDTWATVDGGRYHEISTPVGVLREAYRPTEAPARSPFLSEHLVKSVADLRTLRYVVEATHYEPDFGPCHDVIAMVREDGVVVNSFFCVPFIQFAKTDVGYADAYLVHQDYPQEVRDLLAAYSELFLQGYKILSAGPADIIATGDNMDELTMPPDMFRREALPFYARAAEAVHGGGKLFEAHWCGRTPHLLEYLPGSGLDIVEAVVTTPMASIDLPDAISRLAGEVTLQGGIPSVLVCREGCSEGEFDRYIVETIVPLRGTRGFVLGMSDNVPPNADFGRVARVADLIRRS